MLIGWSSYRHQPPLQLPLRPRPSPRPQPFYPAPSFHLPLQEFQLLLLLLVLVLVQLPPQQELPLVWPLAAEVQHLFVGPLLQPHPLHQLLELVHLSLQAVLQLFPQSWLQQEQHLVLEL